MPFHGVEPFVCFMNLPYLQSVEISTGEGRYPVRD